MTDDAHRWTRAGGRKDAAGAVAAASAMTKCGRAPRITRSSPVLKRAVYVDAPRRRRSPPLHFPPRAPRVVDRGRRLRLRGRRRRRRRHSRSTSRRLYSFQFAPRLAPLRCTDSTSCWRNNPIHSTLIHAHIFRVHPPNPTRLAPPRGLRGTRAVSMPSPPHRGRGRRRPRCVEGFSDASSSFQR